MADLSKQNPHGRALQRVTNNRDAIIPARRNEDLPSAQVHADMRNAYRGDASEDIRRALGMVQDTGEAIGRIKTIQAAKKAEGEFARGTFDASTGKDADPTKAKSIAYQRAYYRVKAEARQGQWERETATELQKMVNSGASLEDIKAFYDERETAFVQEAAALPLGETRASVGERLLRFNLDMEGKLDGAIRERTNTETLTTAAGNLQTKLRAGEAVDFEAEIKPLIEAGMDPKRVKDEMRSAVVAVALDPENPNEELIYALLESKRADGKTPSFAPEEQAQLINAGLQAQGIRERRENELHEERKEDLMLEFYQDSLDGKPVTAKIDTAVAAGDLTPAEGMSLRNAYDGLLKDVEEGDLNEDLALDYEMAFAAVQPNYAAIRAKATADFNEGRFGTSRSARRAYVEIMARTGSAARAQREAAKLSFEDRTAVKAGRSYWASLRPGGEMATQDDMRTYAYATQEYEVRVRKGEDPIKAADEVAKKFKLGDAPRAPRAGPARPVGTSGRVAGAPVAKTYTYDSNGNLH